MYSVIDEVEWRYISSLLRAPQPDTAVYLSGSDFQHPAYGEVFDAVQAVREEMPDAKYGRV